MYVFLFFLQVFTTLLALWYKHLTIPLFTWLRWWDLKWRYLSVCVSFLYTVDVSIPSLSLFNKQSKKVWLLKRGKFPIIITNKFKTSPLDSLSYSHAPNYAHHWLTFGLSLWKPLHDNVFNTVFSPLGMYWQYTPQHAQKINRLLMRCMACFKLLLLELIIVTTVWTSHSTDCPTQPLWLESGSLST